MIRILFIKHDGTERQVEVASTGTVMEAAVRNAVAGIDADCGGACACATCHVHVDEAWWTRIAPPSDMELSLLEFATDVTERSRLSCQIRVSDALDGLVLRLPARDE